MPTSFINQGIKFISKTKHLQKFENFIIFCLSIIILSILNLPVWKDFMHSEDLYALGLYSNNNNHLLATIFSSFGNLFFRPSDLLWGIAIESIFDGNPNILRVINLLLTCLTIVLLNIILNKLKISKQARYLGIVFFIFSKVHFTTIGYLSSYEVITTTIHQQLTLLFLIIGVDYKNNIRKINWNFYLLSLFFFVITVLSRDTSFLFIITITFFVFFAKNQERGRFKKIFFLIAPYFAIILGYIVLRYLITGVQGFGISNNNYYSIDIGLKDILNKLWIFAGNMFNLPFGYKESFGIGSIFSQLTRIGFKPSSITVLEYIYLGFGIFGVIFIFFKEVKNKKIILLPFSWILASFLPLFLIPTYRIYYLYASYVGVSLVISFILNEIKLNKLVLTITSIILIVNFLNLLVHNHRSTYYILTHRWTYKVAENGINKFISQNNKNEIESLTIISSNTEVIDYVFNASPDNIFLKRVINPKVKFYVTNNTNLKLTKFSDLNPVYNFNENLSFEKVEL